MKRQLYRELLLQAPHSFQAGCLASTQKQFSHVASVLIRHRRVLRNKKHWASAIHFKNRVLCVLPAPSGLIDGCVASELNVRRGDDET